MAYHASPWMILPFALWLFLIALAPLFSRWWAKHYGKLALLFAAMTVGYYVLVLPAGAFHTVLQTARDYFSFIILIGSLYVVSGGIQVSIRGEAGPLRNVCFLALGGLAANVLGTTGATVLLIRPWLRLNGSHVAARHVVFFTFIVANIGGGLTPIGDPPLLLGFLRGVPFWWVLRHCWLPWLFTMGILLGVFYAMDRRHHVPLPPGERCTESIFVGWLNVAFLAIIVGSVLVPEHGLLREGLMLAAASGSYLTTKPQVHDANQFHFEPILEVAVMFFGIFATMMPAMDWLRGHAGSIVGHAPSPSLVYWCSGGLSSVLDSAPAYLAFASALSGVFIDPAARGPISLAALAHHGSAYLTALSIATVFFGAVTYIGNAPNLMVKTIAERAGAPVPTFAGYFFKWAVPILLPLLLIIRVIFVR